MRLWCRVVLFAVISIARIAGEGALDVKVERLLQIKVEHSRSKKLIWSRSLLGLVSLSGARVMVMPGMS